VGVDAARVLRKIEPRNISSFGVRRYHEALRVEDDPPCYQTAMDGLGCAGTNNGYWTASLW
jgi:nicotinic acid phosphoribosyltransferase